MAEFATCTVTDCTRPGTKRGWCETHYRRWQRHGSPDGGRSWAERRPDCIMCGEPTCYEHRLYCSAACRRADKYRACTPGVCALCGCDIGDVPVQRKPNAPVRKRRRNDSRFCAGCAKRRSYRHKHSARALAARDGTDCGICGAPVDLDVRWPNPRCPSVDHVISRADGGDDDPSNLQLAHLDCNMRKQRRSNWTEAAA